MNKIFKVIFSKAKGCYVVVSELAKSAGKGTSASHIQRGYSLTLAAAVLSMMMGMAPVGAEDLIHDYSVKSADTTTDTNYKNGGAQGSNSLAAGVSAKATGASAVAIGNGAQANQTGAIALGNNAIATGASAVAIGNGAQASQTGAIALGNNASAAGIGAMVIGQYNTAKGQNSLAFGGGYNDANKGNTASSTAAVAFGERSWAVSEGSVAFGYGTQAGNTITDKNGKYTGQNAVAFGNGTKALGGRSLAFGENTTANYNDSVAFGNGATAFSSGATAFGNRSRALSQYSTSFGDNSVAAGSMSFAFGTDTIAGAALDDNGALELTDGSRMDSYGNKAYTTTDTAGNKVTYSIKGMDIPSGVDVHDYVVVTGTKADGTTGTYVQDYQGGIAEVKVNADGTVTKVKDLYSGKLGGWYQYDENGKLVTNAKGTYVVTPSAKMTSIPVTLDKATPGSNGYTLKGFKNATAFGYSTEASGDNATAFGNDTKAKASAATAFGTTTTASGDNATAFGLSTTASGKQTTAFGSSTTASGDNATAFGENSTASGEAATAFGIGSTASGKNSLAALGGTASAENAAAIGNGAQATLADSVALGSNSKATRAKYIDLTVEKEKAAYAKYGSTGSAWEATDNAIAVGNDSTVTRQITGVAAGSLDTDAVNVAQLKAVDARHTTVSVGGQQAQADNAVVKGGNLEMTRTTSNGQANYDVSLNKDIVLGQQEENKGGSIVINSVGTFRKNDDQGNQTDYPMKEAVKIDGTTVSVVKHDGSDGGNDQRQVVMGVGQDTGGYVALYDNTGKKPTYIFNAISPGITYLKDKDSYLTPDPTNPNDERASNEFNRLEYGDYRTSTIQFIATLDDGQKYAGDNYQAAETETKTVDGKTTKTVTKEEQNVLLKKLNERLDIQGGADKNKLTEKNIGVNVDSTTGVMKVQLAQNLDLTDKGSVKMGNTTVSNGGVTITPTGGTEDTQKISLTDNGLSNGGKQITHVDSGLKDAAGNPVDLATAIGDVLNNAVNVGDLQNVQKVASAHTAVTVNGSVEAPAVAADGKLGNYTDKEKGNLLLAQKKDTTTGQITYDLKLNDNVILGKDGSDGKDGQEGTIGLTGKDGIPGTDGKQRYSTTIIKTEKGQAGADGKTGKENLAGTDMTRIVYTDKDGGNPQIVATLSDGLKFAGDDISKTVDKKLNDTLQIRGDGTYNAATHKTNDDGNIKISSDAANGTIKVALSDKINLHQDGSLTVGGDKNGDAADGNDPILIKYFDAGDLTVTGTGKDGKTPQSAAGDYVTGLDNKDWDVSNPTYVSGRAATEDQLAKVSEAINKTAAAAGNHTVVTVNDKDSGETTASAGTDGKYGVYSDSSKGNLLIAAKTKDGQTTYNIKLNDQLAIGQKGEPGVAGKDGKDGKVTVETKGGTTVVIGHDGEPGKDGKDGLFVTSKDGADGVSITGPNGADGTDGKVGISGTDGKDTVSISGKGGVGHIGLTGPKGEKGKDGISIDITTDLKSATLDDGKNVKTVIKDKEGKETTIEQAPRIQYNSNGKNYEVATMDDGLKFVGDDGTATPVTKKLNDTLQIRGDGTYDVTTHKTNDDGNIKISSDAANGTIQVALSDKINLHQAGALTVGGNKNGDAANGQDPIVIKHFDDKTLDVIGVDKDGKPTTSKEGKAGDYVTGLDNKDWDVSSPTYVSGRAATEDQLKKVSDAVNKTAAQHTIVTVNDNKDNQDIKAAAGKGTFGEYAGADKGNLLIAAKDDNGQMTYNIKLNDQLVIGQKGEPGVAGKDGKVTVETKGGTTVVIGHDGEPGKDGKDGLFVTSKDGADGKSGVSITGPDGVAGKDGVDGKVGIAGKDGKDAVSISGKDGVGHIGLTGPKGEKGADGTPGRDGTSIDILTDYGTKTLDSNKNVTVDNKEQASRIIYNDAKGPHEVATMDDGLKIGANAAAKEKAANPVSNKLNSTINIKGSNAKADHTYTDDNLTTTVEQDADGNTTVKVLMDQDITGNSVTVGKDSKDGEDGKAGYDGQEGSIGIAGKNGIDGKNGKQGITTTIIKTEKGQNGKDGEVGKQGAPGVDGKDITRIVYQNGQDGENGQGGKHVVATLDDGLKFVGDDGTATPVTKKLNDTLQIRGDGTYDATTKTNSGNIQTSVEDGTIKVALNDKINLHQDGSLTVGGDKNGDAANGQDPIVIKHFDDKTLDMITGVDKDGKPTTSKEGKAGDYVTGLDNKDWNVDKPEYVSGRAATEDQLKEVSNAVTKATETAGKHTVVTVEGGKDAGTTNYNGENLKLKVTDTAGQKTYDLKLNDNLSLGTVGKDGEKGTDGSIGLKGADGKSSIGLNGRDGISVIGKDGKNGVSITGSNGLNGKDGIDGKIAIGTPGKDAVSISGQDGEGHIGLTGPAGKDGKDASADIHVKNGQIGVDGTDGNNGKDGMDRIVYDDHNGKPHEVATMDDGLKFVGNDDQEVTRKLNETLSIKGGLDKDAVAKASTKNLGVRKKDDGLEIVMTDTPDFTKVTVGGDNKITIGGQTVTGKKADGSDADKPQTGNYITGLDNKAWDKDNIVENRAATEGQLKAAINDIKGSANGGFGLADGKGGTVKKDLGDTVTVKGDGKNIETTVKDGALEVSLKKDVDLGQNGSIKAGETTINSDGVDTNKVTIKDSSISISKDGINGGSKQITHVASGASEIIKGEGGKDVYKYDNDTNAANIGDVKRIAGDMKTEINNNISNVTNKVDQIGQHVDNIQKDVTQLQQDVKADRTYQGDDGAAKKVKVKFGSFLSLTGGAQLADLTEEGNIGVVQKEIDDPDHKDAKITGLSVRLAKRLNLEKTTYTLEENGQTYRSEIDGKGLTINTGDANRTITMQDGNVNMGGNQIHHVAPGQAPDDAVNVSQLNATNYAVNKLDTRVNRVGANAAALAALHPLDFDPDDKWDFSAGYGHYKDANAAAVGAFYRPNEDTMFSVGGSFGGGENMVNAGVSVKLGQGNHVSTSRVAMAKEIKDLKKDVAALKAVVNQQSALIDKLTGVNAGELSGSDDLFPDVPANHWAYEYVTRLKQAGILTGYPDGNFAGDRMMTRYEFAAIVYRAIMAGAAANPSLNKDGTLDRLAKEFSSEMKYIRIDTIRKDRNGRPTIQRVRVIKEDEK